MIDISVIIPVYNVEEYLEDCLKSVLNQTFDSYEVICVNDCTEDNSVMIVEQYMRTNKKLRIVHHKSNMGLSESRNTGLRQAIGKYVLFVDSDDMIEENTLEELFRTAEESQLDEIIFDLRKIYQSGIERERQAENKVNVEHSGIYSGRDMFCTLMEENNLKVEVWRRFLRKDFLIENNIWFYKGILHEDNLFSFLCDMKAQKVKEINKDYYIYRQRENSIMRTKTIKRTQSLFIILHEIYKYWCTHDFSEREHSVISQYLQQLYGIYCYHRDNASDSETDIEFTMGDFQVRSLYAMLTKPTLQYVSLTKDKIAKIKCSKYIILFGAGYAAREILMILGKEGIGVNTIAVSTPKNNVSMFYGYAVEDIKNLVIHKEYATVIIGATTKYAQEMEQYLLQLGFKDIIKADALV